MNTTKRFDMAMAALVGAFFTNTLAKGTCTACAVGNITARANGVKILDLLPEGGVLAKGQTVLAAKGKEMGFERFGITSWKSLFYTNEAGQSVYYTPEGRQKLLNSGQSISEMRALLNAGFAIIQPTGYSAEELAKVEYAFETSTKIMAEDYAKHTEDEIKEDQYNGLMAVTDILCQLDGMDAEDSMFFKSAFSYEKDPQFQPANAELVDQILVEA